jgi:pyruvate dehydrogenase E2 component (dihydrolipoamide acetyltransferase)
VHIAIAVDTERGLIVPVLRNANTLNIRQIANERQRLVERAVNELCSMDELSGGTFTISNLGTMGIDYFTPIINPPQVAILAVGRIRQAPAVHAGQLCIRHTVGLAITCDHRIVDGAPAARFLKDVCNLVENPNIIWP